MISRIIELSDWTRRTGMSSWSTDNLIHMPAFGLRDKYYLLDGKWLREFENVNYNFNEISGYGWTSNNKVMLINQIKIIRYRLDISYLFIMVWSRQGKYKDNPRIPEGYIFSDKIRGNKVVTDLALKDTSCLIRNGNDAYGLGSATIPFRYEDILILQSLISPDVYPSIHDKIQKAKMKLESKTNKPIKRGHYLGGRNVKL